jgi:DNA-binding MarR family transcriptional regulator
MTAMSTPATPPRWLDDAEMRVWRNLVDLWDELQRDLESALLADQHLELGDYQVLVYLSEAAEHRLRMCDLAQRLHLSPSGLTRRLDGLVNAGLVAREASVEDRRVSLAVLTEAGMARLVEAAPDHVAHVRRNLLDHLSRSDVERLGQILVRLRRSRADASGETLP